MTYPQLPPPDGSGPPYAGGQWAAPDPASPTAPPPYDPRYGAWSSPNPWSDASSGPVAVPQTPGKTNQGDLAGSLSGEANASSAPTGDSAEPSGT